MGSHTGLGIGLSFVFGCIFMGLVAELYYLLWWKKKKITFNSTSQSSSCSSSRAVEDLSFLLCWKKTSTTSFNNGSLHTDVQEHQDLEMGSAKELVDAMHSLTSHPRFLFTITEEDLESEDNKSTTTPPPPFLSPQSSPTVKALDSYSNPLFEAESEMNIFRSSSPPKLKFLRDAEDKLIRRLLAERHNSRQEAAAAAAAGGGLVLFPVTQPGRVLPLPSSPQLGCPETRTPTQTTTVFTF